MVEGIKVCCIGRICIYDGGDVIWWYVYIRFDVVFCCIIKNMCVIIDKIGSDDYVVGMDNLGFWSYRIFIGINDNIVNDV